MQKKRGRPKEHRVTMNITVKPETKKTIRRSILHGDKTKDTCGKVVDHWGSGK